MWTLFTDIVGGATGAIVSNAGLVKKVYFPRELLTFSVVGAALVNAVLQVVVLVGAYVVTRQFPPVSDLYLVPLALLVLVLFSTALGLLLGAMNVYLRDVEYLVEVGLLLWFWMTPIVYDWTKVRQQLVIDHHLEWLFQLYMANPMTNIVLAFQRALWPAGHTPEGSAFYYDGDLALRLGVLACGEPGPPLGRHEGVRQGPGQLRAGALSVRQQRGCRHPLGARLQGVHDPP